MGDGGDIGVSQFTSQETDEWATPPAFVRPLAEAVGGFDLDPASGAERSPVAEETYTEADDGLSTPWHGRVWCNPPYSDVEKWVHRAVDQSKRPEVDTILLLCKGDSSTNWWQSAISEAEIVAMIDRRLSFGNGSDSAPFPSHVFGFGSIPNPAKDVLARQGTVLECTARYERTKQERIE